jgi:hypothetical protein
VFAKEMGLKLVDEKTGGLIEGNMPTVPQFLNRILSLTIPTQNRVFDAFMDRFTAVLEVARERGTLDVGTETVKADSIKKTGEQLVYQDPRSGAKTQYVKFDEKHKVVYRAFKDVARKVKDALPIQYVQNIKSGRVWAATGTYNETDAKGNVTPELGLWGPTANRWVPTADATNEKRWKPIDKGEAQKLWDAEIAAGPKFQTTQRHLITGAILPVWERLKGNPRIFRLQTDDGEKFLGRFIEPEHVNQVLSQLGLNADKPNYSPQDAVDAVVERGERLKLSNGWTLKRARAWATSSASSSRARTTRITNSCARKAWRSSASATPRGISCPPATTPRASWRTSPSTARWWRAMPGAAPRRRPMKRASPARRRLPRRPQPAHRPRSSSSAATW